MNPILLLLPVAIHAVSSLALYYPLYKRRVAAVIAGKVRVREFKLNTNEPPESQLILNAMRNQNETGAIFYAACIVAYLIENTSYFVAGLAWAFVIFKIAHLVIHTTTNRIRFRRNAFFLALFSLMLLWITNIFKIVGSF